MLKKTSTVCLTALAVGLGSLAVTGSVAADGFNPMNMMNPGKWFGNKNDGPDLDDLPPPPPPGYGPHPGMPYGAPPPGPGYGALPPPGVVGPGLAPPPVPQGGPIYNAAPNGHPPAGYAYGAPAPALSGYGAPPQAGYGAPQADPYGGAYQGGQPQPSQVYQGYAPQNTPSYTPADSGPSRDEMAGRIQELEQRLQEMEAKSRAAAPAPQPTTPPPASYQYYSGDQTQDQGQTYPFRPMELGR